MEPAWHSGVEIGVGVMASCLALVGDYWLLATNPPRRGLLSLSVWLGGGIIATTPLAVFDRNGGWLIAGILVGLVAWAAIELRRRVNHWIYVEWPEDQRRENDFRAFKAKSFDGD
jgi:hypothetical protein